MIALECSKQEFLSKHVFNFAFFPDEISHEGNVLKKGACLNFFKLFQTSLSLRLRKQLFLYVLIIQRQHYIWAINKCLSNCSLIFILALITNFRIMIGHKIMWKGKSLVRDEKNLFSLLGKTTHFSSVEAVACGQN